MTDRTSAEVFGLVFETLLHELPIDDAKRLAHKIWPMTWRYDFSPGQMEIPEVLLGLGLATMKVDPRWPEEGEVMHYATPDAKGFES